MIRSRRVKRRCIHWLIWSANTFGVAISTVDGRLMMILLSLTGTQTS